MKKLIFLLALSAFSQQTGYKLNPFTGLLDLAGNGFTAPSGYSNTVTAQTTLTVTAATHGQGTAPVAFCFDNATPALAVSCSYTVSSIGDVVFTWSPAFTGTVIIRGPGANAGAAGDVVGPSSSTAGCIPYFSGTSGKILAGDCSALFWDATNDRLGVGTNAPVARLQVYDASHIVDLIVGDATNTAVGGLNGYRISTYSDGSNYIDSKTMAGKFTRFRTGQGAELGVNTQWMQVFATTGNVIFGSGTTEGNYKADITSSGSTGTFRIYDQSGAGSTLAVIQAGAAQSGNLLSVRNNAGTEMMGVSSAGAVLASNGTVSLPGLSFSSTPTLGIIRGDASTMQFISDGVYRNLSVGLLKVSAPADGMFAWSNGNNNPGTTLDLALARNAAGVLEVNNGTAGTLRDLTLRNITANAGGTIKSLQASGTAPVLQLFQTGIENWSVSNVASVGNLTFFSSGGTALTITPTLNAFVGGSSDGNYKFSVNTSGSTGTVRIFDQGGAGSTLAVIQAGAAQSGNLLSVRNNAGTDLAYISSAGISAAAYFIANAGVDAVLTSYLGLRNDGYLAFASTANASAAKDLGLARSASGILEINNGTAGTYRDLRLRTLIASTSIIQGFTTPASASDTGTAGQIAWDTNYIYIATGTNTWKRVAIATW